jgi:DNA ligase-associated metallophosphoesterase
MGHAESKLRESICPIEVAGERVLLLPERAAWWPARSTLLIADLHLGKEASFRRGGVPIPDGVLEATLARLTAAIDATHASRIVILGDLIHARDGMSESVIERFTRLREAFAGPIELVIGNHDRKLRALPEAWDLTLRDEDAPDGPFRYRHEPLSEDELARRPEAVTWCGHLHPTVRVVGAALPAFVVAERQVILPAFTSFSRGPGFRPTDRQRIYAIADGAVIEAGLR